MSDEEFLLAVRCAYSYIEAQSDLDKYKAQIRAEVIDEILEYLRNENRCIPISLEKNGYRLAISDLEKLKEQKGE